MALLFSLMLAVTIALTSFLPDRATAATAAGCAGAGCGAAAAVVMSKSFYNGGTAATPAGIDGTFPVHTFAASRPGAVPRGMIMAPTVGGRAVRYQADRCARPWADGSQTGCQFTMFLPRLAAGAREQVVWSVQPGAYSHLSGCTVACVTAHSDLKVELTQVNNTYWFSNNNIAYARFGFYVDPASGSVTGGVIGGEPALGQGCTSANCYAFTIKGCAGSTPTATATLPATVTITNPGSGCPTQGSGNYTASVNTALANGAYSASNHCGIVRQYLKGPVADGWEVVCRFTDNSSHIVWAFPGPVMRAFVEDYKNADGSVYAIRAMAMVAQDEYQPKQAWTAYTYDVQWLNGTACIRCAAQGYLPLTRIVQADDGAAMTFGADARPDWIPVNTGTGAAATGAALNAVVATMNPQDKALFKAAGVIEPIDDSVAIAHPVIVPNGSQNLAWDEGSFNSNTLGQQDCVAGWGTAGNHCWFAPVPSNGVNHYIATTTARDYGMSWLQNVRIAAATQFSCQDGVYEAATRNAVNLLAPQVFNPPPGMTDPVRPNATILNLNGNVYDMANNALPCWGFAGGFNRLQQNPNQWDHYSLFARYAYVIEGEEWQLQSLDAAVSNLLLSLLNGASFGGKSYFPLVTGGDSTRAAAWALNPLQEAVKFLPPSDPNAVYYSFILFDINYPEMAAFFPYVGPVSRKFGFGGPTEGTKPDSYVQNGFPLGPLSVAAHQPHALNYAQPFQDLYWAIVVLDGELMFGGESPALDSFAASFIGNYIVTNMAANKCLYNALGGFLFFADDQGHPNRGWQADAANPERFNTFNRYEPIFETFAGQQEVEVSPLLGGWANNNSGLAATATAAAAGGQLIQIDDVGKAELGAIAFDIGPSCRPGCANPGQPPPAGTGAIPSYFYVAATSGKSGPGWVRLACGASAGCSSPGIAAPGVKTGDVIVFSRRLDYPDTNVYGYPPGRPMPSGTAVKPIYLSGTNAGYVGLGPWPIPGIAAGAADKPYLWCPDLSANPNGTTGFINRPGSSCTDPGARVSFAANGAQTWGFAPPLAACPTSGTWEGGGVAGSVGQTVSASGRVAEWAATLKLARAILGELPGIDTALNSLAPLTPPSIYYQDQGSTYWAFGGNVAPRP